MSKHEEIFVKQALPGKTIQVLIDGASYWDGGRYTITKYQDSARSVRAISQLGDHIVYLFPQNKCIYIKD